MASIPDLDLAVELTGLCTFLVQGPEFDAGDDVELVFVRDRSADGGALEWLPLNAALRDTSRNLLNERERTLGNEVVLVGATLSRTGGFPRDSMNRPSEEYDPDALTLSDVRIVDRHPAVEGSSENDGSNR